MTSQFGTVLYNIRCFVCYLKLKPQTCDSTQLQTNHKCLLSYQMYQDSAFMIFLKDTFNYKALLHHNTLGYPLLLWLISSDIKWLSCFRKQGDQCGLKAFKNNHTPDLYSLLVSLFPSWHFDEPTQHLHFETHTLRNSWFTSIIIWHVPAGMNVYIFSADLFIPACELMGNKKRNKWLVCLDAWRKSNHSSKDTTELFW